MYTAKSVRKVTGTTQNLLSQWVERKQIKPTTPAEGQGTRNLFDVGSICQIKVFQELNRAGLNRKASSEIAFSREMEKALRLLIHDHVQWEAGVPSISKAPLINLVHLRHFDGRTRIAYWGIETDPEALLREMRLATVVVMVGLSDIVYTVMEALGEE